MDPVCRRCRRAGEKLFLKGEKCTSPKCPFSRRSYAPGMHGQLSHRRLSEYGRQLAEKQRAAKIYGLREGIFRNYYERAAKVTGSTNQVIVLLLESRLDSVIFRSGIASSRSQARQMIAHGHVKVNDRKTIVPSYEVKAGDKIRLDDKIRASKIVAERQKILAKLPRPKWISLDAKSSNIEILRTPDPAEIDVSFDPALVVEYYSR